METINTRTRQMCTHALLIHYDRVSLFSVALNFVIRFFSDNFRSLFVLFFIILSHTHSFNANLDLSQCLLDLVRAAVLGCKVLNLYVCMFFLGYFTALAD